MAAVLQLVFNVFPLVWASSTFLLVNLTKVSTAAHSMYSPKFQFQLGSPPILLMAPELTASFTPTSKVSWKVEVFSLCMFLLLPNSPRGPPWNEGHQPKVRHETSVLEVPAREQHEHSFCSSSTNAFISYSLYMVHRYCTSPGAPDLRARLGWLQGSTRNGM